MKNSNQSVTIFSHQFDDWVEYRSDHYLKLSNNGFGIYLTPGLSGILSDIMGIESDENKFQLIFKNYEFGEEIVSGLWHIKSLDIEEVKKSIDNFLLRISKLQPFI